MGLPWIRCVRYQAGGIVHRSAISPRLVQTVSTSVSERLAPLVAVVTYQFGTKAVVAPYSLLLVQEAVRCTLLCCRERIVRSCLGVIKS